MRKYLSDLFLICIIFLTILVFWIRLFYPDRTLIATPDFSTIDSVAALSWRNIYTNSLKQHTLPFWESKLGEGYPVLGDGTMGIFFLPNLILYTIFDTYTGSNISLVLSIFLASIGIYLVLRYISLRRTAALFGALTFALSGIPVTQATHLVVIQSFGLMPLIIFFLLVLIRTGSLFSIGSFAFLLSQQILVGFPQATFITLLVSLFIFVLSIKKDRIKKSIIFGFALSLALLSASIQLIPSYEFTKYIGGTFDPLAAMYFSFFPKFVLTIFDPFLWGSIQNGTLPMEFYTKGHIFWENTMYFGIVPLVVIGFVLIQYNSLPQTSKSYLKILFLIIIIAGLLMFGKHSPLYIVYSVWPFSMFRVPSRFVWIFAIALIMVASIGYDVLLKKYNHNKIWLYIVLIIHLCSLFFVWRNYHWLVNVHTWLTPPNIVHFLPQNARVLTIGRDQAHNAEFIPRGWNTPDQYLFLRNTLSPDTSAFWDVDHHSILTGRSVARAAFIDQKLFGGIESTETIATVSAVSKKLIDMSSINVITSTIELDGKNLILLHRETDKNVGVNLYLNTSAQPRAYLATKPVYVQTIQDVVSAVEQDSFIPGTSVLVEKQITIPDSTENTSRVEIVKDTGMQITLSLHNISQPALLVFNDTYYPGWTVTVDNIPGELLAVNIRNKGVVIPANAQSVVFTFKPTFLVESAIISGTALTITMILMMFPLVSSVSRILQKATLPLPHRFRNRDS